MSDLEEKLEAEKRRKAEEEAERKRLAEERRKEEEERARAEEEKRKELEAQKKAELESASKQAENVIESRENVTEPARSVSSGVENGTEPAVAETIRSAGQQASVVVDPFEPKQEEKRYRTKFCAVGTRAQLQALIQFMNENNIEYGRIK